MKLPEKGNYLESTAFYTWMGEDGICRTRVKEGAEVTIVEARENSEMVLSLKNERKYPLIVDSRKIKSMTKEARDFFSLNNRPSPVNSIAIIVGSTLSRVIGNFFIGLNRSRVPNKLFNSPDQALKWLNKFIVSNE